VKEISSIAAACLLVFALSGCGKSADHTPDANLFTIGCSGNLRGIDGAKSHWARDRGAGLNDTPTMEDLLPYFRHGMSKCPGGGTYTVGKVSELPQCSIPEHNNYFKDHLVPEPNPAPAP
jgi:hypothetical protein